MPQIGTVIAAVWGAAQAAVAVVGSTWIGRIAIKIAISVATSALLRALGRKPRSMQQGVELQTKLDPAYPREVGVGTFATGGTLAFENVSGSSNQYLWRVIALSDCEIEEITKIRGNGADLTFSGDIHTGLRACTSHFQSASGGDMLSVRIYKGTASQTADADLLAAFPSLLDSNFRGRGVAYALLKMTYDNDAWSGGSEFVFVGKGAKPFDPRTDTTTWTENAALITRQYLKGFDNNGIRMVGLGCADADLPDADWEAAADECDESVPLAAGGSETRYRAGGMISSRDSPREVMGDLMAAMDGRHVDSGGAIKVFPGVARSVVLDISESDMLADESIVYVPRRTSDERMNARASTYVSPSDGYQEASLPPRKSATRITRDGARYETGDAFRLVQSRTQGQRLDEIALRRGGYEAYLSFSAPLWALELEPGDWFTATSPRWGSVAKTFEVESIGLSILSGAAGGSPSARCAITAREIAASAYDWTTADEIAATSTGAMSTPSALPALTDETDRIRTADALPLGALGGTGLGRSVTTPLSSSSSTTIAVASHTLEYVGRSYSLPSATLTGLSVDTEYGVFYDLTGAAYVASATAATVRSYKTDPSRYLPCGYQRTQNGGGGYSPPPSPPAGFGGGGGGGGGGVLP